MEEIIISGLTQNNLKNISLNIPKNRITVFTGVSGSGKSSIVFDTIAARCLRASMQQQTQKAPAAAPEVPAWCRHWPKNLESSGDFDWEKEFHF